MQQSKDFDKLWDSLPEFHYEPPERNAPCPWAVEFKGWVARLIQPLFTQPDNLTAILHAKIDLQDGYFQFRADAPKQHRNTVGDGGHACIFAVYEQSYRLLRQMERNVAPSPLAVIAPEEDTETAPGLYIGEQSS